MIRTKRLATPDAAEAGETVASIKAGKLRHGLRVIFISGCPAEASEFFQEQKRKGELTFRFMCMVSAIAGGPGAAGPDAVQRMAAQVGRQSCFRATITSIT